jgi:hypothetical protein
VSDPDPSTMEAVFRRYLPPDLLTTRRDREFLSWRYLDAPYRHELCFYYTHLPAGTTHYAIVRYLPYHGSTVARVLDLFGDLDDETGLQDLLRTIIRDAVRRESVFLEAHGSSAQVTRAARRCGLLAETKRRFRWRASDPTTHRAFAAAPMYWTIGDSELDYPY